MSPETTGSGKTFDTFCPSCDTEVTATVVSRIESLPIRGEDTSYIAKIAVCPLCGYHIGDSRIEEGNLIRAYDAYRRERGIMQPDEIKALREEYELSLRDFGSLLGFDEQTAARYEAGSIPSEAHSKALAAIVGAKEGKTDDHHQADCREREGASA